mgnify:CR=1 FL=1|tara:strand:- start:14342 stop:15712 length:1371 start_codon:yes stop_codon:yes gene_type:complete
MAASEALQALNRVLQYRESRDKTKIQEALGFMELAMRKDEFAEKMALEKEQLGSLERHRLGTRQMEEDKLSLDFYKTGKDIEFKTEDQRIRQDAEERVKKQSFLEDLQAYSQKAIANKQSAADDFINQFGFQEAALASQEKDAELSNIVEKVQRTLKGTISDKQLRATVSNNIAGAIFSSTALGDNDPILDIIETYYDSLDRSARGEVLDSDEKLYKNAFKKLSNKQSLIELGDSVKKNQIIIDKIKIEEDQARAGKDYEFDKDHLQYFNPSYEAKPTPPTPKKTETPPPPPPPKSKNQIIGSLNELALGDINNLAEKTVIDVEEGQNIRNELMTAAERRHNIQTAIQEAERTPASSRNADQIAIIEVKEKLLAQADLEVESLENQLNINQNDQDDNLTLAELQNAARLRAEANYTQPASEGRSFTDIMAQGVSNMAQGLYQTGQILGRSTKPYQP